MKKITRLTLVGPVSADALTASPVVPSTATPRREMPSRRRRALPLNQLIKVREDVDTLTLLNHASEILDSLAAISATFADEFDGSKYHVAVAIKQLSAMAEMLVCRARDNLDPSAAGPETRH